MRRELALGAIPSAIEEDPMLFWMKPHISNGLLRVGTKSLHKLTREHRWRPRQQERVAHLSGGELYLSSKEVRRA